MKENYKNKLNISELPSSLNCLSKMDIMSTVGPTFKDVQDIEKAIINGCRMIRLPLGYRHCDHLQFVKNVSIASNRVGVQCEIFADFPSAMPRLKDDFETDIINEKIYRFTDKSKTGNRVLPFVNFEHIGQQIEKINIGDELLMLDGRIKFIIKTIERDYIEAKCIKGKGKVKSGNKLLIPGAMISYPLVTNEDIMIIKDIYKHGFNVDWVILSMINNHTDVEIAQLKLKNNDINALIMGKIETDNAVNNAEKIIDVCDGIMIGRGDLGLSVSWDDLPSIQLYLMTLAKNVNKPCITATQTLEIYADSGIPQRCELVDVAFSSINKASGIMLGKETVYSNFPLNTISLCDKIIKKHQIPHAAWIHHARNVFSPPRLIAIEGPDGAGKTTLINQINKEFDVQVTRGVPTEWEYSNLKTRVLNSHSWQSTVLFYLSGIMEQKTSINTDNLLIMDRSVWSTLTAHAMEDPDRLPFIFDILDKVSHQICYPDLTIYLDVDLTTSRQRSSNKTQEEILWDKLGPKCKEEFNRQKDFFVWLSNNKVPVKFVNACNSIESVIRDVKCILKL